MKPAALILGYQRYDGIIRVLQTLTIAGVQKVYLSLDGPKSSDDEAIQEQILAGAMKLADESRIELYVSLKKENLGLRAAVVAGIDWFFQQERSGYILEDDLDIDLSFFEFCMKFSEVLESHQEILLISGNQFFEINDKRFALKLNYPLIWGWFTTADKWETIRSLIFNGEGKANTPVPLHVKYFWKMGRWRAINGQINSWAIPVAANFRLRGYFSIVPPINLVSNLGNDKFASNTTSNQLEMNSPIFPKESMQVIQKIDLKLQVQPSHPLEKEVYRIQLRHLALGIKLLALKFLNSMSKS